MEKYEKAISNDSIFYAFLKASETFFATLYNNQNRKNENLEEIIKILPFRYNFFLKIFGPRPIEETVDFMSEVVKEFFKTKFAGRTTEDVLKEILSKYKSD